MGFPKNPLSYDDCRELLDRALESPKGLKISFDTKGKAVRFRHRLNSYRSYTRTQSTKIYKEGEPGYNRSPYDGLVFSIVNNDVLIRPVSTVDLKVTEL